MGGGGGRSTLTPGVFIRVANKGLMLDGARRSGNCKSQSGFVFGDFHMPRKSDREKAYRLPSWE